MKRLYVAAIFLLSLIKVFSQPLTADEHDRKLASLSEEEKIDYVIANIYELYSADFDHAIKVTQHALSIATKNQWKNKEASCEMFLGVIYYLKGDSKNSLSYYLKAYHLFDSLKNYDGLAKLCNEMSVFHRRHSDAAKSHHYLDLSEQYAIKADNKNELGTSYSHRAVLFNNEGKTDAADKLNEKVYQIRLEQKDSVGLGYALLDLSSIALRKSDVQKALNLISQSTAIRTKIGDKQGVAVNLVNTGETFYSLKEYKKAVDYFHQSLTVAKEINYNDLVRYCYDQLADSYVALGDYQNAFLFQRKSRTLNDSLYNIEKAKAIAELEAKFQTEKKEHQIMLQQAELENRDVMLRNTYTVIAALLASVVFISVIFFLARSRNKRQQELLQKENELSIQEAYAIASVRSQENERKRFAQDLHDGMGQLISALRLSLLSVNKDSTLEERVSVVTKAEGLLNDMHREIRSIAFNLMPQTLILHGLVPALKEMSERINSSGKFIIRINSFDIPDRLTEVQEISLYRVIQEWINNVVKYSNAKLIEVQLVGHDIEIMITIEDDGEGFDVSMLERSEGNGWRNIQSRVNLIKGKVEIDSQKGRISTTLILRIPIVKPQEEVEPLNRNELSL